MCALAMEEKQEQDLTMVDVAMRLGVSIQTVRRRIDMGRIRARKEGQEWRISRGDLQKYIDSTYHQTTEDK